MIELVIISTHDHLDVVQQDLSQNSRIIGVVIQMGSFLFLKGSNMKNGAPYMMRSYRMPVHSCIAAP